MSSDTPLVRTIEGTYSDVMQRIPDALRSEGFGVLTTIDVQATLKTKIGVDMAPYTIIGACNPKMAHKAISMDPSIGVHLPCNLVLRELQPGLVEVRAVDPVQTIAGSNRQGFEQIAKEVQAMLARAVAAI